MGDENHFDTFEEAEKFVYEANLDKFGIIPEVKENDKKKYKQIPNSLNKDLGLSPAAHQVLEKQMTVMRDNFNPSMFQKVGPNPGINKPLQGGLWTSTVKENSESEWTEQTRKLGFYRNNYKKVNHNIVEFVPSADANVLTIDNEEDFAKILEEHKEKEDKHKEGIMVSSFGP